MRNLLVNGETHEKFPKVMNNVSTYDQVKRTRTYAAAVVGGEGGAARLAGSLRGHLWSRR
jgi:hypothetical protein